MSSYRKRVYGFGVCVMQAQECYADDETPFQPHALSRERTAWCGVAWPAATDRNVCRRKGPHWRRGPRSVPTDSARPHLEHPPPQHLLQVALFCPSSALVLPSSSTHIGFWTTIKLGPNNGFPFTRRPLSAASATFRVLFFFRSTRSKFFPLPPMSVSFRIGKRS